MEGDLDSTEGHSQLLVGTLPLTYKDPPENPEGKGPPPDLPVEGLASGSSEHNTRDKNSGTTPPTEKSKQVVDSPSEYPHKINQRLLLILGKTWKNLHLRDLKKFP